LGAVAARARIRAVGARHRRRRPQHHHAPRAAQPARAGHRADDAQRRQQHPAGKLADLPRPRRRPDDPVLGRDAGGRPHLSPDRLVDLGRARHGDPVHGARPQPHRRLAARPARPDRENQPLILFEKTFAPALAGLAGPLSAATVETWTFDDAPTRRAAEAAFAARGIEARCRSAYKPLVVAFREEIDTRDLARARVVWPRHPQAGARRFLLESYPLTAMFPDVAFEFVEGEESEAQPAYAV